MRMPRFKELIQRLFRRHDRAQVDSLVADPSHQCDEDPNAQEAMRIFESFDAVLARMPRAERNEFRRVFDRFSSSYPPAPSDARYVERVMDQVRAEERKRQT
jgi:hypothetical protein